MGNAQSQTQALPTSKATKNPEHGNNLSWPSLAAPGSLAEDNLDNLNINTIVEEDGGSDDVSLLQRWIGTDFRGNPHPTLPFKFQGLCPAYFRYM